MGLNKESIEGKPWEKDTIGLFIAKQYLRLLSAPPFYRRTEKLTDQKLKLSENIEPTETPPTSE